MQFYIINELEGVQMAEQAITRNDLYIQVRRTRLTIMSLNQKHLDTVQSFLEKTINIDPKNATDFVPSWLVVGNFKNRESAVSAATRVMQMLLGNGWIHSPVDHYTDGHWLKKVQGEK